MFSKSLTFMLLVLVIESNCVTKVFDSKDCDLGSLIEEIASYDAVVKNIIDYAVSGAFKGKTYDELAKFVDKFGARPSGTDVLEKSIDYMINLSREEGLKDIVTEDVEMKAWSAHDQDTSLSCCRTLHVKHAAYASALYTLNISILVVLLYSWRIGINAKRYKELDDVYYGVQIAYIAIIGTQMFMIVLSIFLFYGIYKENVAFLVPWVVGCMTFMALEAMAMVYSNILRDHVNKQFDSICKAEISFLIPRIFLNCLCIWCVLRLYHLLRSGVTWKGAAAIEL